MSKAGAPEFHYTIDANPVFDAFRTTPTSGAVPGSPMLSGGLPVQDWWAFDLPDTGTLFPGDVLHYYIRAGDDSADALADNIVEHRAENDAGAVRRQVLQPVADGALDDALQRQGKGETQGQPSRRHRPRAAGA